MPSDTLALAPMRAKHRPRFRRAAAAQRPAFRLTERDRELLKIIFEYRFITAPLLQDLVTPVTLTPNQQQALDKLNAEKKAKATTPGHRTKREILRRLQMLYHNGYVQRRKLSDWDPIVYSLGNLGADELVTQYGFDRQEIEWTTKARESSALYMEHGLLISRFRHAFELALRHFPDVQLETWLPSGAFTAKVTYPDVVKTPEGTRTELVERTIKPDGMFIVTQGNRVMYHFLEADRSRMSNKKFAKKIKAYYEFWKADKADVKAKERDTLDGVIKQIRVITLTISELRKENLRKTAQEVSPDAKGLFWFICEKAYLGQPEEILRDTWQTLKDDTLIRLYPNDKAHSA